MNDASSSFSEIKYGVFQGNIYMFLQDFKCDIFSYAGNNTPDTNNCNLDNPLKMENCCNALFQWFKDSFKKANPNNYHPLVIMNDSVSRI